MIEYRWRNIHPTECIRLSSGRLLKPKHTVWSATPPVTEQDKDSVGMGWLREDTASETCDCCGHTRRVLVTREV